MSVLLLLGGGVLIGALLALLGAGGSILLLPLLVTGLALPLREAVPLSLLVVLLLALANLIPALRQRRVAWRPALWLGIPALAGSWVGAGWVRSGVIAPSMQLMLFALAALAAAWLMLRLRVKGRAGFSCWFRVWGWACSRASPEWVGASPLFPPWCCWPVCR